jgi:cytochrome P450
MRADGPVLWSPDLGGYWIIAGAEEVREAYQNGEAFSSYPVGIPPMVGMWPRKLIPEELDGEEHARYRRLLAPFFAPKAIRAIADSVRERAAGLLRRLADAEGFEVVGQLARPLPSWVFLGLFGAPVEQADLFTAWAHDLLHSPDLAARGAAGQAIVGYLIGAIAEHRANPGDDMISGLTQASIEGRPLTDEELLDMCFLIFVAGLDTVTSQIGTILLHLATHPDDQQAIRHDPAVVDRALEELLRLYPIISPARTLTRDYTLAGVRLKAGDTVLLGSSGATRDPQAFADPTRADFGREATWTTAFGLGVHRCLGSHLARQELRVVLELMATTLPPYELAPGAAWHWHTGGNLWGLDRLDLRFIRS